MLGQRMNGNNAETNFVGNRKEERNVLEKKDTIQHIGINIERRKERTNQRKK